MKPVKKVIITCAPTGSIHTPTMSPYLPVTADDIAKDAIDAVEAGASILHLHARDPITGQPKQDPKLFSAFLPRIKQQTNAVINITTGGGLGMSLEERIAPAHYARPEVCSLNMGSMNFGTFELAKKYSDWKHDWEKPYLESTYSGIYPNTFEMIDHILTNIGDAYGTRFEFECYDISHLYNLAYFFNKGRIKPPLLIQGIFGIHGGMGADPENLTHLKTIADKLFGDDYILSVFAVGKEQMKFLTMSAAMGGNVRCGLEDSLFIGKGELAKSSAEQVIKIKTILEELGLEIATPAEAREMLALKGGDQVGF
ncbi:MAG: 3-keto-5-aminohexanoate cleavage protein [Pseudomonadota bacterium]